MSFMSAPVIEELSVRQSYGERTLNLGANSANLAHFVRKRGQLETKLLRKIDTRTSIPVVIYLLNYVSLPVKF